jgi:CHAD domain-containing protein
MNNKMKNSLTLDKKLFLKKLEKISDNFYKELDRYITNPDDESIHDIRVSIRRLESAYRILPKEMRKQEKIRYYLKQIKSLFKSNAVIRDYDIICANMESRYKTETIDLVSSLKSSRNQQLKNAKQVAIKISDLHIPKVSRSDLKNLKLKKRYHKVVDRTILNIQKNMIIVLDDEKRVDELHALRKDFKKLRYSLEIASNKETTLDILKNLKNIQDILGEIHDSDIIIDHLKSMKQDSTYSSIIEAEMAGRSKKYSMFAVAMEKSKGVAFGL